MIVTLARLTPSPSRFESFDGTNPSSIASTMACRNNCLTLFCICVTIFPCSLQGWVAGFSPLQGRTDRIWIRKTLLSRGCRQNASATRRFLSATSQIRQKTVVQPKDKVIYQKVLKSLDDDFLSLLVEHLQAFELPSDMPMIYEAAAKNDSNYHDDPNIVQWDSPLSPSPDATCLKVQIVAISSSYQNDESLQAAASFCASTAAFPMAMVVVQKRGLTASSMPVMVKNLFEDCEKSILKRLERSLQNFVLDYATRKTKTIRNQRETEQAMLVEILDDIENGDRSEYPVEADATSNLEKSIHADIGEASPPNDTNVSPAPKESNCDFAVQAAKKAVTRLSSPEPNDFAVEAAKRAAAKKKLDDSRATKSEAKTDTMTQKTTSNLNVGASTLGERPSTSDNPSSVEGDQEMMNWSSRRPPAMYDSRFISISKPTEFAARRKQKTLQTQKEIALMNKGRPLTDVTAAPVPVDATFVEHGLLSPDTLLHKNNLVNAEIQRTAEEALGEMSGKDISPEELLQNVMQFGDQQEKFFATGAFEKAKELLREQHQQREEILSTRVSEKPYSETVETSSDEELLRLMFEAGERMAENMITTIKQERKLTSADEKRVDDVIAADMSGGSYYARNLDEDLVELAARINKSPSEAMDGPRTNPIFDVFSGPELYNPNVDPEIAVNWPGALSGSSDIKLPSDLQFAVSNAQFAAEVLFKLQQRDSKYFIGTRELTAKQVRNLQIVFDEAVEIGLIADPLVIESERSRLQVVINELWAQPEERFKVVASNYKELFLSDYFPHLVRERLNDMADRDLSALRRDDESLEQVHERERQIIGNLIRYAQLLLKETRALGAQLETSHLEVVRSICKVAMDPSHVTEDETSIALTDAVREMRPLFDDSFVAYLKYAVVEEEGRLARSGVLDDPAHNQWLFVLQIVQQGVYAELTKGVSRYVDHIMYVLRMETAQERTMLLGKLIDVMPTLDVRPFVQVVENVVGSLGDSVAGNFKDATELGEMTNRLLQLHRDVKILLPPERIALLSKDADDWAAKQKARLMRNRDLSKQRLQAAEDTDYLDNEVDSVGGLGEMERIE
ncbi:hypothetical protein MPSEU_000566200 [Mayamaea pseudoterrestris]|nr:hypothetical protein MPSEU_000566200 [Mayamaea pseudoterrestris]